MAILNLNPNQFRELFNKSMRKNIDNSSVKGEVLENPDLIIFAGTYMGSEYVRIKIGNIPVTSIGELFEYGEKEGEIALLDRVASKTTLIQEGKEPYEFQQAAKAREYLISHYELNDKMLSEVLRTKEYYVLKPIYPLTIKVVDIKNVRVKPYKVEPTSIKELQIKTLVDVEITSELELRQ